MPPWLPAGPLEPEGSDGPSKRRACWRLLPRVATVLEGGASLAASSFASLASSCSSSRTPWGGSDGTRESNTSCGGTEGTARGSKRMCARCLFKLGACKHQYFSKPRTLSEDSAELSGNTIVFAPSLGTLSMVWASGLPSTSGCAGGVHPGH